MSGLRPERLRWLRFWFVNSYRLWRDHPKWRKHNRAHAAWRGVRAAWAGYRTNAHLWAKKLMRDA